MSATFPDSTALNARRDMAEARRLVQVGRLDAAMVLYRLHLKILPLEDNIRSELQVGLAAALCLAAQAEPQANLALTKLDKACALLETALKHRIHDADKVCWANRSASLAEVYLARYARSHDPQDILKAHLALDGTEAAFANDTAGLDWVSAMRAQLQDLRDRRHAAR